MIFDLKKIKCFDLLLLLSGVLISLISGFRLSHAICVSTANYEKLPDKRCIDEELEPLPPKRHSCTLPLCNQPQNHTSIT